MSKTHKRTWTIIISDKDEDFVVETSGKSEKEAMVNYILELFKDNKYKIIIAAACRDNDITYVKNLIKRNANIKDVRCVEGDPQEHFGKLEEYRTHLNKPRKIKKIIIGILWTLIGILSIIYFAL